MCKGRGGFSENEATIDCGGRGLHSLSVLWVEGRENWFASRGPFVFGLTADCTMSWRGGVGGDLASA